MHVGEPVLYEAMLESFEAPNTVILEEGVRDESQLLGSQPRRPRTMNRYAVLTMQPTMSEVRGANPISQLDDRSGWVNVQNADVDLSVLSEPARQWALESTRLLNKVRRGTANLVELLFDEMTPSLSADVFSELLYERNDHLIGELADYRSTSSSRSRYPVSKRWRRVAALPCASHRCLARLD